MHKENKRTVRDIEGDELGTWILKNHGGCYSSQPAFMLSFLLAKEFYNHESGYAHASIERLLKDLGASTRAVKQWITRMREVRDENGKPLWEIERSVDSRNGKVVAHRYYPLFLKDILEASQPVAAQTPIRPLRDRTFKNVADLKMSRAGEKLRTSLEAYEAYEEDRIGRLFKTYLDNQPRGLSEHQASGKAFQATVKALAKPSDGFDTSFRPETLLDLVRWNERYGENRSASITDEKAKGLSDEQRYVAGLILAYWSHYESLKAEDKAWLENSLIETWLAHSHISPSYFYRRFMHFYQGKLEAVRSSRPYPRTAA